MTKEEFYGKVNRKEYLRPYLSGYFKNGLGDLDRAYVKDGTIEFVFKDGGDICCDLETMEMSSHNQRATISEMEWVKNNYEVVLDRIAMTCEMENEDGKKKFSSMFANGCPTAINDIENQGDWAWGGRFVQFSYNRKTYVYKDYDSGAYSGFHCHRIRSFSCEGQRIDPHSCIDDLKQEMGSLVWGPKSKIDLSRLG